MIPSPGAARWLSFVLSRCLFLALFLFLVLGSPSVLDSGQDCPDSLNICGTPKANSDATNFHKWRERDFLVSNVTVDRGKADT